MKIIAKLCILLGALFNVSYLLLFDADVMEAFAVYCCAVRASNV